MMKVLDVNFKAFTCMHTLRSPTHIETHSPHRHMSKLTKPKLTSQMCYHICNPALGRGGRRILLKASLGYKRLVQTPKEQQNKANKQRNKQTKPPNPSQ